MPHSEFPLPQELLELIVSYISHDIPSLRNLLPVCRAFGPVARKHLYRDIILLDHKNDPYRAVKTPQNPIVTISEAAFIGLLPSIGHLVKSVRIRGSTRSTKQKTHVTSKRLHLILPRLVSLQSISFQRTRLGPRYSRGCVRSRYVPYMLMTAEIAKAIPRGVHTVWLSKVRFEGEAAVDVFFGTCRGLAHLGLDQVSVLNEEGSLAKRVWSMFFPPAPRIPLDMEPIELRSYAHGNDVSLLRLPFTDSEKAPYFELSSVTSLKLRCWDTVPTYWETLLSNTASTVQDLMIATALYAVVYHRASVWNLAGHKRLRSLFIVLFDFLPETPFPDTLQHLTILVYKGDSRVAWGELDVCLDRLLCICSVKILVLASYYPLVDLADFCTSAWDFEASDECREEVFRGMPLLSQRGILSVKLLQNMNG